MIKLSRTSKLDNIRSWSLEALDTCPGSKNPDGTLVPACSGCYATTGFYRMTKVKDIRQDNKADWKRADWVSDMVAELDSDRYFRWFDSGDVYHIDLAKKILEIMRLTPHVRHWLPTRMMKFEKFQAIFQEMQELPNVMVRFSADTIDGTYQSGVHGSVIVPDYDTVPEGVYVCPAYQNSGKCGKCRACYSKTVETVAYPQHGKKMKKVWSLRVEFNT